MDNMFNSAITLRLVDLLKQDVTSERAVEVIVDETLEVLNSLYSRIDKLDAKTTGNIIDILDKNIAILKVINTEETKICYTSLQHIKTILIENILKE